MSFCTTSVLTKSTDLLSTTLLRPIVSSISFSLALLRSSLYIVKDPRPRWLVHDELIQTGNLLVAIGTDEISLQQMCLNAFLAIGSITAWGFYGVSE